MKSEVKLTKKGSCPEYPAFYQSIRTPLTVMFTESTTGIVVVPSTSYAVGHYDTCWVEHIDKEEWTRLPSGSQIILTQE